CGVFHPPITHICLALSFCLLLIPLRSAVPLLPGRQYSVVCAPQRMFTLNRFFLSFCFALCLDGFCHRNQCHCDSSHRQTDSLIGNVNIAQFTVNDGDASIRRLMLSC